MKQFKTHRLVILSFLSFGGSALAAERVPKEVALLMDAGRRLSVNFDRFSLSDIDFAKPCNPDPFMGYDCYALSKNVGAVFGNQTYQSTRVLITQHHVPQEYCIEFRNTEFPKQGLDLEVRFPDTGSEFRVTTFVDTSSTTFDEVLPLQHIVSWYGSSDHARSSGSSATGWQRDEHKPR